MNTTMKAMRRTIVGCLLLLEYPGAMFAQNFEKINGDSIECTEINARNWEILLEEMTENSENEGASENWQEILSMLAENPIPLNTATKEMLESIPFLRDDQTEALSYYIYRYGPLVSLSELLLVEGMDEQTLRWLKPFVYLEKPASFPIERPSLRKALKYGKQELSTRVGRSLQEKAGFVTSSDSTQTDKSFSGDPYQVNIRYGFNYKGKMQWGVVLEKDAGEKIWNKKNRGIDYASFHFVLKDQKRIKTLMLGDYHLKFGQGLVCANSFSLGKSATGTSVEQTGTTLSRHFSSSESNFFRGFGATFVLKPFISQNTGTKARFGLDMTTFASLRNLDAKISNNCFTTISTSELHRTTAESAVKDKLGQRTLGVHILIRTNLCQFGLTGLTYSFNASCNPEWKPYNSHSFRGRNGANLSID